MRRSRAEVDRLVEENRGLVLPAIQRYFPVLLRRDLVDDLQDAMQEGSIGLLHAARTWDETRAAFSVHAYNQIRHRVGKFLGLQPGAQAATEKRRAVVEALPNSINMPELWACSISGAPMESWCCQFEEFAQCRMQRLGLDERTFDVIMADMKGERQKDIAARLGLNPQTPSNIVRRNRGLVDWQALASEFLAERVPA